jgi:hypothetical protein
MATALILRLVVHDPTSLSDSGELIGIAVLYNKPGSSWPHENVALRVGSEGDGRVLPVGGCLCEDDVIASGAPRRDQKA